MTSQRYRSSIRERATGGFSARGTIPWLMTFAASGMIFLPLTLWAGDPPAKKKAIDADQVQRVLLHLRKTAETNAAGPKKSADDLSDLYIRELAGFCVKEKIPTKEFLISLGVGLDAGDFLRRHPLTRGAFKPT